MVQFYSFILYLSLCRIYKKQSSSKQNFLYKQSHFPSLVLQILIQVKYLNCTKFSKIQILRNNLIFNILDTVCIQQRKRKNCGKKKCSLWSSFFLTKVRQEFFNLQWFYTSLKMSPVTFVRNSSVANYKYWHIIIIRKIRLREIDCFSGFTWFRKMLGKRVFSQVESSNLYNFPRRKFRNLF